MATTVGLFLHKTFIKAAIILVYVFSVLLCPIPIIFFSIWKSIVTCFAWIWHRNLSAMRILDYLLIVAMDIDIEDPESKNLNGNVGITCKLNGKVDGHKFFDLFEKNVINIDYSKDIPLNHKHIRFHQSFCKVGGYWFFKTFKNKLKYEDHVTCTTLENNNSYEEEICKWLKVRYDLKKCPLWGIQLIYREESHDTIFAFKIHHALADGFSLVHILDLLGNTQQKQQVQESQESKWKKFKILAKASYGFFVDTVSTLLATPDPPINKMTDDEIFLTYITIPAPVIKEIRQKAQVRFQAVMLNLILNYINALFWEKFEEENIPDNIFILNSFPWPNRPQNELCNHFALADFWFKLKSKNNASQESLTDVNNIFQDFSGKYYDRAFYHSVNLGGIFPVRMLTGIEKYLRRKLTCEYGHTLSSADYPKVFDFECQDTYFFMTPPKQKIITVIGVTISNEIRLTIMGPKSLFSSQEQVDKFSKDNFQHHIIRLLENTSDLP